MPTSVLNIRDIFRNCLPTQTNNLGFGTITIMSLGKVDYDPKHVVGFVSVAKLVEASKNNKRAVEEWL